LKNFITKILKDIKDKEIEKKFNKFLHKFGPATGSPTATVLRLRPSPQSCCRNWIKINKTNKKKLGKFKINSSTTSNNTNSHGVTGGVYKD
jgi:hypothetical protein